LALYTNLLIFIILVIYFDGGAYPWGQIRANKHFVVANMVETEVSSMWFWVTYWQGLAAWVGPGIYGVCAFGNELSKSSKQEDERKSAQNMSGLFFVLLWTAFTIWVAVGILK